MPSPPRSAAWTRPIARLSRGKFRTTAAVYAHAGLQEEEALLQANVEFVWRYYGRLFALLQKSRRDQLIRTVQLDQLGKLEDVLATNRSAILVSPHLGDFEIAGAALRGATERELVVVVDTVRQRSRQAFFDAVRKSCGLTLRRSTETSVKDLQDDLLRGSLVALLLDRTVPSTSLPAQLLGLPARLSACPWKLSLRSGLPVVPVATWTSSPGLRELEVGDPLEARLFRARSHEFAQLLMDELSRLIRKAPHQWHVPASPEELPFVLPTDSAVSTYRGARIRTGDLRHPKAARYQAAPHPVMGKCRF